MSAIAQSLLTGLIDYAGLFPPAGLGMDQAIRNYHGYLNGDDAWMLGRFVLLAARLREFTEAAARIGTDVSGWRLSVLASANDAATLAGFDKAKIDSIEIRANNAEEIKQAARAYSGEAAQAGCQLYFEPLPAQWTSVLQTVGVAKARAKIRTGGEEAAAIPAEGSVLQFLRLARERRLAFKATAGLHHPLRSLQRLTYKEDSASAVMHGFVNVFAAATLLWHEPKMSQEAAWILAERDVDAVSMDGDTMVWLNSSVVLTAEQVRTAREQFCISFGSCSFTEPIAEMRALGWL